MSKYLSFVPLSMYNIAAFLRSQLFLLPVLLFFYQENGLTVGDFYLIQGLIVFFAFLFEIPAGYLGDIFPRKYILITAYALFLGRLFLWIFFRGFEIILIGEFLYACSKACFDSVSSSFIYDILKKNNEEAKMVKAYSNFNAAMYIGTGIAALLGAGLYEKLGSHVLLIAEFIIYSTAILLLSFLPNAHRPAKDTVAGFKERLKKFWVAVRYILKSRKYCYLVLFSGFMVGVSHFFFWSFQPLMKSSGIDPSVSLTDLAAGTPAYLAKRHGTTCLASTGLTISKLWAWSSSSTMSSVRLSAILPQVLPNMFRCLSSATFLLLWKLSVARCPLS